jgi:formylglycine-generating enzyme required for sulfatase activity
MKHKTALYGLFHTVLWLLPGMVKALPEVTGTVLQPVPGARQAVVTYNLSEPAIVTLAIETNGVRLAEGEVTALEGDVCRVVQPGAGRQIIWNMGPDWPERQTAAARAVVQAWPTNTPPPVMVIDLYGGPRAAEYPVYYYTGLEALPDGGLDNEVYRTLRLVMKRVRTQKAWPENGRFLMGSPVSETGRVMVSGAEAEAEHEVVLTKDYYLGLFELTQSQWYQVVGATPGYFREVNAWEARPVEYVSYRMIRSSTNNTENAGVNWPTTGKTVGGDSFVGLLRARTGLGFDLPTEAQWEYACRAGTRGALHDGTANLTASSSYEHVEELARCTANRSGALNRDVGTENGTARVGSYRPNAWGFYDMHGNVLEYCLDWFQVNLGAGLAVDPRGPDASAFAPGDNASGYGYGRVLKGGALDTAAWALRSAYRRAFLEEVNNNYTVGFRLAVDLE